MNKISLGYFYTFVIRTPLMPLVVYRNLIQKYSQQNLQTVLEDKLIKTAIQIASPELITAYQKTIDCPNPTNNEKQLKIEIALLKYIARISARSTPFGLFA